MLLALWWLGCVPSEANFPDAYGRTYCSRLAECDQGTFQNSYTSMSDCKDRNAQSIKQVDDVAGAFGCNYDRTTAGKCLSSVRTDSCGDFDQGKFFDCDKVYDCGGS